MNTIQIILIACVLLLAVYALTNFKQRKLFLTFMLVLLTAIILFPDSLQYLAQKVGVNRGVDLLFYITFLLFIFIFIGFYKKLKLLEKKMTDIVRKLSVLEGEKLGSGS